MNNVTLDKAIEQFVQRGSDYLETRMTNARARVWDQLGQMNRAFAERPDSMAFLGWSSWEASKIPSSRVAPEFMRFGSLHLLDSAGNPMAEPDIPFLLPMKVNAVLMNLGEDADKVPALFQNIILRLLLSMRLDLVKVSVIDMDFGSSFPVFAAIENPIFKHWMIFSPQDVSKLMEELAREISEANRHFLGHGSDIDDVNADDDEEALPYHFVFIDDFPNGFSSQAVEDLLRMIANGNATRAGIRFFLNYSDKNPAPREFDISRFTRQCASMFGGAAGRLSLANWKYTFPARTVPRLELEVTEKAVDIVSFIRGFRPELAVRSLEDWIENLKETGRVWKGSTLQGINVPVGFITPSRHFDFYMANDTDSNCNDFFALIAGNPGYGKTSLLHNIIVNAAMKYSPDELSLYLADFADGTSFSIYRDLPHVKALMLSNNKEYALRMLEDLAQEGKNRARLFQQASRKHGVKVDKLSDYRTVTGKKLPRILFIMDEFHYLFLSMDQTAFQGRELLCNGIRQWRKYGISVILCTQSITGVNFGDADTKITYRFAFSLGAVDSRTVIGNAAAESLVSKGQAILNNTPSGAEKDNILFQCAYSVHYPDHVKYLADLYARTYSAGHVPFICEPGTDADVADNPALLSLLLNGPSEVNHHYCEVYVGHPDLLRDSHTRIHYRRQPNSNTLLLGDDYRTLVCDLMVQLVQMKALSHPDSRIYVVDCFNYGDPFKGALDGLERFSQSFRMYDSRDAAACISELHAELERRRTLQMNENLMTEERVFLVLLNAQNCYALRPQQGRVGMGQSEPAKQLLALLTDGAPLGIHCLVHGFSFESVFKSTGFLDWNKHGSLFENMVLLRGADVDKAIGLKVPAPDEEGLMVVVNAKLDGEAYEQCKSYSDITTDVTNVTVDFISEFFERFRYV